MNIQGYCKLTWNAQPQVSMGNINDYRGKVLRVMEFGHDGSVMCVTSDGQNMGMFNKEYVAASFKCGLTPDGNILTPPEMHDMEIMVYAAKVNTRNGGYKPALKNLILGISLMLGKFDDSILWGKPMPVPPFNSGNALASLPTAHEDLYHLESTLADPTAIETIICENMERAKKYPIDEEMFNIMVTLLESKKAAEIPEKEKPQLIRLIEKRITACHSFTITDSRLTLLLAGITERPGFAVMYLWYLQYWCFYNNRKEVTLDDFVGNDIPNGTSFIFRPFSPTKIKPKTMKSNCKFKEVAHLYVGCEIKLTFQDGSCAGVTLNGANLERIQTDWHLETPKPTKVEPILRPLSDIKDDEKSEYWGLCGQDLMKDKTHE